MLCWCFAGVATQDMAKQLTEAKRVKASAIGERWSLQLYSDMSLLCMGLDLWEPATFLSVSTRT